MALTTISGTSTSAQTLGNSDELFIAASGSLAVDGNAVTGTTNSGEFNALVVNGSLFATSKAYNSTSVGVFNFSVGSAGNVTAVHNAVDVQPTSSATITNAGTITSTAGVAIYSTLASGDSGAHFTLMNSGSISGGYAIFASTGTNAFS